jgi:hypothetical protein
MVRNGARVAVTWSHEHDGAWVRTLGAPSLPLGSLVRIEGPAGYEAIAPVGTGFVLATTYTWRNAPGVVRSLGADGAVTAVGDAIAGRHPDLAAIDGGRWLISTREGRRVVVRGLEPSLAVAAGEIVVAETEANSDGRVVSLGTRSVVTWVDLGHVYSRSIGWPPDAQPAPTLELLAGMLTHDTHVDGAAYRDWAVMAFPDGAQIRVAMVDPFDDRVVVHATPVAAATIRDRRPGIAPVEERGYFGICWATGPNDTGGSGSDGVAFRLLGRDLAPWGAEVPLASGLANIGGCAAAWTGEDFVVAYWSCGGGAATNRIVAHRLRPTF